MAFSIPNIGFRLTPEEAGGKPSFLDAINKGFKTFQEAGKTAYAPKNMAEDFLAKQLGNKIKQSELDMSPLKKMLLQAQINKANRPERMTGKLANLLQLRNSLPEGHPDRAVVEEAIANYNKGGNGITVIDPRTGQPMVQIGGSGGSGGKGGVKTFQTESGEIVQSPTSTLQTNLQKRIAGAELVKPILQEITRTLPQFQSGWKRIAERGAGVANNWLGTDIDLPSQLQEGHAALGKAAESMVAAFGLNGTAKALTRMEEILKPGPHESPEGYERRVTRQAEEFAEQERKAQGLSGTGIPLNAPGNVKGNISISLPNAGEKDNNDKDPLGLGL